MENKNQKILTAFLEKTAEDASTKAGFEKALRAHLQLKDRVIVFRKGMLERSGTSDTQYIDFFNLPESTMKGNAGGGAEAQNNRMMFVVTGFSKYEADAPAPTGKLVVEMTVSALPREKYKLRKKTGPAEAVAKYLAGFINNVVANEEPKLTHSKKEAEAESEVKITVTPDLWQDNVWLAIATDEDGIVDSAKGHSEEEAKKKLLQKLNH